MNYLNRELSWIDFNGRVLAEGMRKDLPPLERFRFLSIVSSNFDEFFMVRLAALKRSLKSAPPGNGESADLLDEIARKVRSVLTALYACLAEEVFPAMSGGGLELVRPPYDPEETDYLKRFFYREVFPVLTPLRIEKGRELPAVANGIIHGAFLLTRNTGPALPAGLESASPGGPAGFEEFISIVEIPRVLERVVRLPEARVCRDPSRKIPEKTARWALLDDLLLKWGNALFPGHEIRESLFFRVHRDADFSVDEQRDEDFIEAMKELLIDRDTSQAVCMVYSPGSLRLKEELAGLLKLEERDMYCVEGPLNLDRLWSLMSIRGFEQLREKIPKPCPHPAFAADGPIWDSLQNDVLLSLPYHSFDPVVRFFKEAAADSDVISIKTVLYRTSGDSPVVRALEQAALKGKHVTAVVELKARFDEERNIQWAKNLEQAGVIVIYGLARLKIHAKISQIIRRESGGLRRYIHLSTGNYNDKTAKSYSDLSLFTVQEDFGADATVFFNLLSGYSVPQPMRKLTVAPAFLKQRLIELIDREAKRASQGAPGRISAKMNALLDREVIDALYNASRAGVKIQLNVRGICTLVPGVKGLSENIQVVSIVDYFLEHSRILYFNNGGAEEFYLSSADWMPRNLERRVELLVPIVNEKIQEELRTILESYFKDNTRAWELTEDGSWRRIRAGAETPFSAQEFLLSMAGEETEKPWKTKQEFTVRRSPPPERA
ncbi:MAG: polyphosphate kinase 1 [Treponema sp.]|jgi:polyphosphate kinase|nr:polyphosphate kinase 1 [Treponema sp.]